MKIENYSLFQLSKPINPPVRNSHRVMASVEHALIEVRSDGLSGVGFSFTNNTAHTSAILSVARDLLESIQGEDAREERALVRRMWERSAFIGREGITAMAVSMVDTALYDLAAKRAGLSLHRFLGALDDSVDAYMTGGWLSLSDEELIDEGLVAKEAGYRHYKIKLGRPDWRADVRRVEALREALGSSVEVMVDGNQGWDRNRARQIGQALEDLEIFWLEEPVRASDFDGLAELSRCLNLPVAAGENLFTAESFRRLASCGAVDIMMPDLMRCGGITEFMKVVEIADNTNTVLTSHFFPEVSCHLLAAARTGNLVEVMPQWWEGIFDGSPVIENGRIDLTDRDPGLGLELSSTVRRHQVSP